LLAGKPLADNGDPITKVRPVPSRTIPISEGQAMAKKKVKRLGKPRKIKSTKPLTVLMRHGSEQ
jgi:hypothetical protein